MSEKVAYNRLATGRGNMLGEAEFRNSIRSTFVASIVRRVTEHYCAEELGPSD